MPHRLAVVLKGYPRLSETFIAQELLDLERAGFRLEIVSLRQPTSQPMHPVHGEIRAALRYLPEYLYQEPLRVASCLRAARRLKGWPAAWAAFRKDLARDRSASRLRRFGQACVLASELPRETAFLYAHFLHTPSSVARYAALLTGLPWALSAHAKDIWTTPEWEKREKLAEVRFAVTCTEVGRKHLAALAPEGRVQLVYHGLDLLRFPPYERPASGRDGSDDAAPVRILSVGRAVAKKGYEDLLQALALLPPEIAWRFCHLGAGAKEGPLPRLAERLGLAGRIEWLGAEPQPKVLAAYRAADLFVLPSRIAPDGDRDGLPNVLMEAQSQGLACLSTRVSAIPELIEEGVTGLLVPPGEPEVLAAALARLLREPELRLRLGQAGAERVRSGFSKEQGFSRLLALLSQD